MDHQKCPALARTVPHGLIHHTMKQYCGLPEFVIHNAANNDLVVIFQLCVSRNKEFTLIFETVPVCDDCDTDGAGCSWLWHCHRGDDVMHTLLKHDIIIPGFLAPTHSSSELENVFVRNCNSIRYSDPYVVCEVDGPPLGPRAASSD